MKVNTLIKISIVVSVTLLSCQKEPLERTYDEVSTTQSSVIPNEVNNKSYYSGVVPGDIVIPSTLEILSLDSMLQSTAIYSELDISNAEKFAIDSTGLNFATKIGFMNDNKKSLILATHENNTFIESAFTLKTLKLQNQDIQIEMTDLYSGLQIIIRTSNDGSRSDINVIKPTNGRIAGPWWDCMVSEYHYFTSDLAGAIVFAIYHEPILWAWAAKCYMQVNNIAHF